MDSLNEKGMLKVYPINEEILLDLMLGRILTIPGICDRFQVSAVHPDDFIGQWDGDPSAYLSRGLAHSLIEVAGERFALIRPRDFCRFIESLVESSE